jgi:hypothetical protein
MSGRSPPSRYLLLVVLREADFLVRELLRLRFLPLIPRLAATGSRVLPTFRATFFVPDLTDFAASFSFLVTAMESSFLQNKGNSRPDYP